MSSSYKNIYNFNYIKQYSPPKQKGELIAENIYVKVIFDKNKQNKKSENIYKNDEPNYEYLKSLENEEQQKDYLGEFLFKKIEHHPITKKKNLNIEIITRITDMILGIGDIQEIFQITSNDESLTSRINEALELLKI